MINPSSWRTDYAVTSASQLSLRVCGRMRLVTSEVTVLVNVSIKLGKLYDQHQPQPSRRRAASRASGRHRRYLATDNGGFAAVLSPPMRPRTRTPFKLGARAPGAVARLRTDLRVAAEQVSPGDPMARSLWALCGRTTNFRTSSTSRAPSSPWRPMRSACAASSTPRPAARPRNITPSSRNWIPQRFCHLLCRWVCAVIYRRVGEVVAHSPGP